MSEDSLIGTKLESSVISKDTEGHGEIYLNLANPHGQLTQTS
jgi:hypothetical protein